MYFRLSPPDIGNYLKPVSGCNIFTISGGMKNPIAGRDQNLTATLYNTYRGIK